METSLVYWEYVSNFVLYLINHLDIHADVKCTLGLHLPPLVPPCSQGGSRVRASAAWAGRRGWQPESARRGVPEPGAGPWTPGRAGACTGLRTPLFVQRVWSVSNGGPRASYRRECLLGAGRLLQGAWGLSTRPQNCSRNSGSSPGTSGDNQRQLLCSRFCIRLFITFRPACAGVGMWLC